MTEAIRSEKLVEYIANNPQFAEALCDAANRITEVEDNGKPIRQSISPSDFSDREWRALVGAANLLGE